MIHSEYILGDWFEHRPSDNSRDLVIVDPVYKADEVGDLLWVPFVRNALRPGGSLYVFGDMNSIAQTKVELDKLKDLTLRNWIIWGPNDWGGRSSRRWGQKHDDILFYTKDGQDHYFNGGMVAVPKKMTQAVFNPSGRTTKIPHSVWDDLGGFSTISKERVKVGAKCVRWQKPERLIERIIRASCPRLGFVWDPFSGVATVPVVCKRLGCHYIATEIDPEVWNAGAHRLGQPYDIRVDEIKQYSRSDTG